MKTCIKTVACSGLSIALVVAILFPPTNAPCRETSKSPDIEFRIETVRETVEALTIGFVASSAAVEVVGRQQDLEQLRGVVPTEWQKLQWIPDDRQFAGRIVLSCDLPSNCEDARRLYEVARDYLRSSAAALNHDAELSGATAQYDAVNVESTRAVNDLVAAQNNQRDALSQFTRSRDAFESARIAYEAAETVMSQAKARSDEMAAQVQLLKPRVEEVGALVARLRSQQERDRPARIEAHKRLMDSAERIRNGILRRRELRSACVLKQSGIQQRLVPKAATRLSERYGKLAPIVLVVFATEWCSECGPMSRQLGELAQLLPERVTVVVVFQPMRDGKEDDIQWHLKKNYYFDHLVLDAEGKEFRSMWAKRDTYPTVVAIQGSSVQELLVPARADASDLAITLGMDECKPH